MITYQKHGVRIRETWFDQPLNRRSADIIFASQRPQPLHGAQCRPKHTLCLDLASDPEMLFATLHSQCRYQVRRSRERDQSCCRSLSPEDVGLRARFIALYSELTAVKGLAPLDTRWFDLLAEAGHLDLSIACGTDGEVLACHSHLLVQPRARLLHSVSRFRAVQDTQQRNLIGRANRLLHWEDMMRLRQCGYTVYDLGGWCADKSNVERQRINRFKEEFGGTLVQEWDCALPLTLKGRLALWIYEKTRRHE